jgi:hypothetical protein
MCEKPESGFAKSRMEELPWDTWLTSTAVSDIHGSLKVSVEKCQGEV